MATDISGTVGKSNDFKPCPEGGQRLICCDVVNHGLQPPDRFGKQKVKGTIYWQSEHLIPDGPAAGQPFLVHRRFTMSMHEKAGLRIFVNAWRGKPMTDEQALALARDLDKLIGFNGYGHVIHVTKPHGTFAEIPSLMPLPKGFEKLTIDPRYVRFKDRQPAAPGAAPGGGPAADDDDIPF